jgi:hypothetical protein
MADETNPTEPDETSGQAAQAPPADEARPSEAVDTDATTPAEAPEQPTPAEPATPAPAAEEAAPAEAAGQEPSASPEQPASASAQGSGEPATDRGDGPRGRKPRRDRSRRDRGQGQGQGRPRRDRAPRQPQQRASGPLPFQELRDAATSVVDLFGPRQALRDAFAALGEKERRDLSRLVADDGDWRVRARNIAAGSLGAGRVGKALAAQQISMARVEDLWTLTLSKEEAAERQARIRNARRRDERRAQRDAEREQRSDRVSRADLEKAQDGRVGAQIRIVIGGTSSNDRRRKEEDDDKAGRKQGSDLLDRLGY